MIEEIIPIILIILPNINPLGIYLNIILCSPGYNSNEIKALFKVSL